MYLLFGVMYTRWRNETVPRGMKHSSNLGSIPHCHETPMLFKFENHNTKKHIIKVSRHKWDYRS